MEEPGEKANIRVQRPQTAGKESPGRRGDHGTGNTGWEGKGDAGTEPGMGSNERKQDAVSGRRVRCLRES